MKARLRHLTLSRQGLLSTPAFGKGVAGALKAIEHLAYIQIDTLSVVERAHHHVLWSRLPDYLPAHLHQLVADRKVFEYWHHAASYLPMRDYRFSLPRKKAIRDGANRYFNDVDPQLMRGIHDRIRIEGPLKVRDVNTAKEQHGSWWNWGKGKHAVEKLFMQGDLMVVERSGMQKVYDLTERVLPEGIDQREPSPAEHAAHIVDGTLRAHGFVTWKQLTHLQTDPKLKAAIRLALDDRIAAGTIAEFKGKDFPAVFVEEGALGRSRQKPPGLRLLSPFDNAIIHRERLSQFFGFDYRLECYVPSHKRVYGYFCLPMLLGDRFIGRIDCKVHRSDNRLEILAAHFEDGIDFDMASTHLLDTLQSFANFNNCHTIESSSKFPVSLLSMVS